MNKPFVKEETPNDQEVWATVELTDQRKTKPGTPIMVKPEVSAPAQCCGLRGQMRVLVPSLCKSIRLKKKKFLRRNLAI